MEPMKPLKPYAKLGVCIFFLKQKPYLSFRIIHDAKQHKVLWKSQVNLNNQNIHHITFISIVYLLNTNNDFFTPLEIKLK